MQDLGFGLWGSGSAHVPVLHSKVRFQDGVSVFRLQPNPDGAERTSSRPKGCNSESHAGLNQESILMGFE